MLCLLFGLTGIYNWTSDGKYLDVLAVPLYAAIDAGDYDICYFST